jgi:hypothetical protein
MANTYTSYDVVGKKEDISDLISNISPTDTPFQSIIGKETVHNTLFQWQEDALRAVDLNNAQLDGFDATESALVATTMRSNYTQILAEAIKVSATTDAVKRYGRAKETAYQIMKKGKELKRDLEAILLSGQAAVAGNNAAARKMASYQAQITASVGLDPHTGGAGTAMTEATLLDVLEQLYTNGVDPSILMIPPGEGQVLPGWAVSGSSRYRTIPNDDPKSNKKIINVIDMYASPYGEVRVVMNRFQLNTDYLIFSPENWKLQTLRGWARDPLAKIGDSERHMIVGEFSLKHGNYLASAFVRKAA